MILVTKIKIYEICISIIKLKNPNRTHFIADFSIKKPVRVCGGNAPTDPQHTTTNAVLAGICLKSGPVNNLINFTVWSLFHRQDYLVPSNFLMLMCHFDGFQPMTIHPDLRHVLVKIWSILLISQCSSNHRDTLKPEEMIYWLLSLLDLYYMKMLKCQTSNRKERT